MHLPARTRIADSLLEPAAAARLIALGSAVFSALIVLGAALFALV